MEETGKILEGVKIVDLSRVMAAPFCTQMLSDLGATVWKIEAPWGDDVRGWGPPFAEGESSYFLAANRGKKSVSLNLKEPEAQKIVKRLAGEADVFFENFKTGDLERYGLDYESLASSNPSLIYASVTGFGQTGPRAREAGYDTQLQGLTGLMSITGEPDRPPMKVGVPWIDVLTGLTATVGIFAALRERDSSGKGQRIDLSLFDVGLMSLVNALQSYLMTGVPPGRVGTGHSTVAPAATFETQDGWLVTVAGNDSQFRRLCEALERPDLRDDPRFASNATRLENAEALIEGLNDTFRTGLRDEWIQHLGEAGLSATPVYDIGEALADPQAEHRGASWQVSHPTLGEVPLAANALRHMSRTPASPAGPPPLLGEHTREVLEGELGMDEAEVDALRSRGIVSTAPVAAARGQSAQEG